MRDRAGIGTRIREQRKKVGLTQDDLAMKLNLSREQIVKIESGKRKVQADDVPLFADVLETNCDYLLTGNDEWNTRLVDELGLTNEVIEKLAELTVLRNSSEPVLKKPDDYRRFEIAKKAHECLTAINFLLSNDADFSIIKLIYAYIKMDFSSAKRITITQEERGQSGDSLHWDDIVSKLWFSEPDSDGSFSLISPASSMVFPVSMMENCCLDEIKNNVQAMKRRSEK